MKQLGKNYLALSVVLLGFVAIPLVSAVAEDININTLLSDTASKHIVRLYSLFLGEGNFAKLATQGTTLTISNGIMVGGNSNSLGGSSLSSIGGGNNNTITSSERSGIAGGERNTITNGYNSVIGGGLENTINGGSNSVIAGGQNNTAYDGGIVLGGERNTASNGGIVLGGQDNVADDGSLVMGKNAKGSPNSFAWNAEADTDAARIDAKNGVLIGTVNPIKGVNLVVNGAIKLAGESSADGVPGEIKAVNGCFYAYDGEYWHVINQNSTSCDEFTNMAGEGCQFGNVLLQAGDKVAAYASVTEPCYSRTVECGNDGKLKYHGSDTNYTSPYCYSKDIIVDGDTCGRADLNEDGVIDDTDVTLMNERLAGDHPEIWGDINGDGEITIADVTAVIKCKTRH